MGYPERMTPTTYYTYYAPHTDGPIGPLLLLSDGAALTGLYMNEHRNGPPTGAGWVQDDGAAPFAEARRQLGEYFRGARTVFDLPLAPVGTPFQARVWDALRAIPYGATVSYGALARQMGQPGAARAVGLANGRNPLSIVVPCHRVVGADGTVVGYAGGLDRKRALLTLESANIARL